MRLAGLALLTLLAGCSTTNVSELVKALAQDKNANCIQVMVGPAGGYGSIMTARGSEKTTVTMTAGTCTITGSEVTHITVPISSISVTPMK